MTTCRTSTPISRSPTHWSPGWAADAAGVSGARARVSIASVLQGRVLAVAGEFAVLHAVLALGVVVVHRPNHAGPNSLQGEGPVLLADRYLVEENLQLQPVLGRDPGRLDLVAALVLAEIPVVNDAAIRLRRVS